MPDTSPTLDDIADSTAELKELRGVAEHVFRRAWSTDAYLRLLDGPNPAFDPTLWDSVQDLGWPDLLVDPAAGGGGGNLAQLCVLAETTGGAAAPVPLVAVAAARWCGQQCSGGIDLVLPQPAVCDHEGLSGEWAVVPYGAVADRLVILGTGDGGTAVLASVAAGDLEVAREAVQPLDHNPAARIRLDGAHFDVLAHGAPAVRRHAEAVLRARLAGTAELVGIASVAADDATEYAKTRVAFGHPIGQFQAIKHKLVDQRADLEVARALVRRAAQAGDRDEPDFAARVSLAAYFGITKLRAVTEGAVQVFGGIAYTWEHQAHAHLRRAACAAASLGSRSNHRAVVVQWLRDRDGRIGQ